MNKIDFITSKCVGKNVLDIGCVGYSPTDDHINEGTWVHGEIQQVASQLIGIDNSPREFTSFFRMKGYNIVQGDFEKLRSWWHPEIHPHKFDVIVIGDVIEHVHNQGLFLKNIKSLCHQHTELIITTPNAMSFHFWRTSIFKQWEEASKDHILWHSVRTLTQLLNLYHFNVIRVEYLYVKETKWPRNIFRKLFPYEGPKLGIIAKPFVSEGYQSTR